MKTKLATVVVLAMALFAGWKAKRAPVPVPDAALDTPRQVIYAMLDAGKAGDVPRYLAHYDDTLAATLQRTVTPQYLVDTSAAVKGVALSDLPSSTPQQASLLAQFIYQDRTESQVYYLTKSSGAWKISRTEDAQRAETLVPYGTPVRLAHRR